MVFADGEQYFNESSKFSQQLLLSLPTLEKASLPDFHTPESGTCFSEILL
jgi:hypothetical protein